MAEQWTVIKILKWTTDYFGDKGIASPRLDAELLLADTLALDRVGLYVNFDRPLDSQELALFRAKVRRRAEHEPVQLILGKAEFWSLVFRVDRHVLIPRPDTEVLVEEALKVLHGPAAVLDVGTGSGVVAIALAHERPELEMTAIDVSPQALEIARTNAEQHQLGSRLDFQVADLAMLPDGPYDLIVSNPPYIPTPDWEGLMPEVRDYEPRLALDGGGDGLQAYRRLSEQAGRCLKSGGWLMVEVGIGQAAAVVGLFEAAGLQGVHVRNDYADIPRVVAGQKKAEHG